MSWLIPADTPQKAIGNGKSALAQFTAKDSVDDIIQAWKTDGAVILKKVLSPDQLLLLHKELEPVLETVRQGSLVEHEALQAFHGRRTRRAGDIINHSSVVRDQLIENDFLHEICRRVFSEQGHAANYWLSAASTLNAGGPQPAQALHRDLSLHPPYALLGPGMTESVINFLVATTPFCADNGATRVIPGSHIAPFDQRGLPEESIPALMDAGDILFISGKVVHGMGANITTEERRCVQMSVCASWLTPAEAHPFVVTMDTARKLSKRGQRFLGFRSHYPRGSPGIWLKDYAELALHNGLEDVIGFAEYIEELKKDHPLEH
ncbi:hypothetical protein CBER1_11205 [Cercospora berteroae]|uniref:Fe2OG dioxygenase domain-containing protein n=1 Tax=Cercospora berteroae TaxID=357750 RepID=A0A2S6CMD4_9PEZI|nr:hypothetical protein CBER1_11205 [Cercospora berteroae]